MITKQGTVLVTGEREVTLSVDGVPVDPFDGVALADPTPMGTVTVTIDLSEAQGTLADGPGYAGLTKSVAYATHSPTFVESRYTLAAGTASQVEAELDALVFTPSGGAASPSTGLLLSAVSREPNTGLVVGSNVDATTATTEVRVVPTRSAAIDGGVSYRRGTFTLSGTVSAVAGVRSVEITADVDGVATDLGAAAVDPDGTFVFSDPLGAGTQSFITATLTDGAGGTASAQASFSLAGGLGPRGGAGRQTRYSADGSAIAAVTRFAPNGSESVDVRAGGQTFGSWQFDRFDNGGAPQTTFVFDPGHGLDVVNGFRAGGADHDILSFLGSDFGSAPTAQLAAAMADTHDVRGGVVIVDPTARDEVFVSGVSKGQLARNTGDIAFHA